MHVAIIMDGNGRWAMQRGLPRTAGHAHGAKAVRRAVESAVRHGIQTLTLYAFSSDNWARPRAEVTALMRLFRRYLMAETQLCVERGVRINAIGRRDRLSAALLRVLERSEQLTEHCSKLHLRIAIDYSAQHSILEAARRGPADQRHWRTLLDEVNHSALPAGDVDLLIRTGGEQRLSDFLLWESAYAELYFSESLWPEFDEKGFAAALADYNGRQRRYGALVTEQGGNPR
jgi:undecaprenyl diphosphate synthase